MEYRSLIILATTISVCHIIEANLNMIPRDTEVKINDTTYINCSTTRDAKKIQWRHGENYVYAGMAILEPYYGRFSVEINTATGACNLVIRSVQPSDVGKYVCSEDDGFGETRAAQLIVLDGDPICNSNMHSDGVIGPNSCNIKPEEVKLSCSVTYHGNVSPILRWKKSGGDEFITEGLFNITSINNEVTYTLQMKSTLDLNNSSYICQTTRTSDKHYSCSSNAIKILYVFSSEVTVDMTMNDEIKCSANTSQSCNYKWKWFSGDEISTESVTQILKPKKVGTHRCEATCSLGSKSCTEQSMLAKVYSDPAPDEIKTVEVKTSGQDRLQLLFILLPVFLISVAVLVAMHYRRKSQDKTAERKRECKQELKELRLLLPEIGKTEDKTAEQKRECKQELKELHPELPEIGKTEYEIAEQKREPEQELQESHLLLKEKTEDKTEEQKREPEQELQELRLLFQGGLSDIYKSDPVLVETIGPKRAGKESKQIRGLAILDKELFVVSKCSSEVEVYDSTKFSFSRRWDLPESFLAQCMGSCIRNKCLYLNGYEDSHRSSTILRVGPSGELIKDWPTGDDWGWGLSVTDESNVILTVFKKNKLNEYSPDGQLIREISLSSDACIFNPWHAIKLTNGHFVVSHGWAGHNLHRVCEVDADGKLEKSFGGKCGSTIGSMFCPVYLSVDGKGFVIVVDGRNGRVVLLDADLKFKRVILTKKENHGLQDPWRILLDETNDRLLVADNKLNNQRILIFRLIGLKTFEETVA